MQTQLNLARRIRLARLMAGMTQTDLSVLCGVSRAEVSKYERGKATPPPSRLVAVAHALGTTRGDLLGEDMHGAPGEPPCGGTYCRCLDNAPPDWLVEAFARLSRERVALILSVAVDAAHRVP